MQNVLLFLARYRKLLFFIFLEAICFYWIVSFNKTQKSVVSGWGQDTAQAGTAEQTARRL